MSPAGSCDPWPNAIAQFGPAPISVLSRQCFVYDIASRPRVQWLEAIRKKSDWISSKVPKSPIIWLWPLSGRGYQVMSRFCPGVPDQKVAYLGWSVLGITFSKIFKTVNLIRFVKPSVWNYNSFGSTKQSSELHFLYVGIIGWKYLMGNRVTKKNHKLSSLNTPDHP